MSVSRAQLPLNERFKVSIPFSRIGKKCLLAILLLMVVLGSPAYVQTALVTPPLDAGGWSIFNPSADSVIIYVSSSTGDDNNTGRSPSTAVQTLSRASSLLRKGYPDWMLLKKGDVWTGDLANGGLFGNNGYTGWQGRSAAEPIVIGSYGSGARPLLQAWNSDVAGPRNVINASPSVPAYYLDYVAIVGLEFYAFKHDPNSPAYDPAAGAAGGIRNISPSSQWVLIEDCKTRFMGNDFEAVTGGALVLRRNVIVDNFPGAGILIQEFSNVLLQENFFDHNGWNQPADRSVFTHNVYGQYDHLGTLPNQTWVYQGNISARGSDVGLRSRQGGLMDNNLLLQNGWGFDYGGYTSVGTNAVTNNVVMQGININGSFAAVGISIGTDSTGNGRSTLVSGNIVAHVKDQSALSFGTAGIDVRSTSANVTVTKNIVVDGWGTNGFFAIDNYGTNNTVANDNVTYPGSDLTVPASTYGWPDPYRTIESYDRDVLNGPGTFEHFVMLARQQSKDSWNPALTANAVNSYIRAGFGIGPSTGTSSTTTSTPTSTSPTTSTSTISPATTTSTSTSTSPPTTTSSSATSTTSTTLIAPSGLQASIGVPATQVNLSWQPSPNASTYNVFRDGTRGQSVTGNSFQDSALSPGVSYTYKVAAVNSSGVSSPLSPLVTVSIPAAPVVTITAPGNGTVLNGKASVNIAVAANDSTGVSSITILADSNVLANCVNVSSCSTTWQGKNISPGTHVISATAINGVKLTSSNATVITHR